MVVTLVLVSKLNDRLYLWPINLSAYKINSWVYISYAVDIRPAAGRPFFYDIRPALPVCASEVHCFSAFLCVMN